VRRHAADDLLPEKHAAVPPVQQSRATDPEAGPETGPETGPEQKHHAGARYPVQAA